MDVNIGWRYRNKCTNDHILEINIFFKYFQLKGCIEFIRVYEFQADHSG